MSIEQNIAIVRRYYEECANNADPDKTGALRVAEELLATDFTMRYNGETDVQVRRGIDQHKQFLVGHASAFPGEHWTINGIVADDETVACQWRVQATHAETGNLMDLYGADFFSIRQGQLTDLRRYLDFQTLNAQMASK